MMVIKVTFEYREHSFVKLIHTSSTPKTVYPGTS